MISRLAQRAPTAAQGQTPRDSALHLLPHDFRALQQPAAGVRYVGSFQGWRTNYRRMLPFRNMASLPRQSQGGDLGAKCLRMSVDRALWQAMHTRALSLTFFCDGLNRPANLKRSQRLHHSVGCFGCITSSFFSNKTVLSRVP